LTYLTLAPVIIGFLSRIQMELI